MNKIKINIKMRVTPEQSQKVQEICFENGIGWRKGKILQYLNEPFLYIHKDKTLGFTSIHSEEFFNKDSMEEVLADLFIRSNGTCVESEDQLELVLSAELSEEWCKVDHIISNALCGK